MLATERALLDRVERYRAAGVARTPRSVVEDAIAVRPHLSADQQHMVRRLCLDGAGITTVAGLAGAGKTTALAAAVEAWTGAGYRVTGVALAARTAHGLQEATGAPSMSIARYLHGLDTGTNVLRAATTWSSSTKRAWSAPALSTSCRRGASTRARSWCSSVTPTSCPNWKPAARSRT